MGEEGLDVSRRLASSFLLWICSWLYVVSELLIGLGSNLPMMLRIDGMFPIH